MISYLGSLVQFSPATGRAGRCRQTSLCVDSTLRVLATLSLPRTGVSVLSPSTLLRLPAALYGVGPALSAVPVFWVLHKSADSVAPACCVFPGLSGSGSQRLGRPLPGCCTPFPSAAGGSGSQRLGRPLPRCGVPFTSVASGPGSQRLGCTFPGCGAPFPSVASGSGSQRLGHTFPGCGAPFPSAAPTRRPVWSQEVFR